MAELSLSNLVSQSGFPCQTASDYCSAFLILTVPALNFDAAAVTGVDIDPNLITQARDHLSLRASRVRPPADGAERTVDYFPLSAILQHGYRSKDRQQKRPTAHKNANFAVAPTSWPCVKFISEDWAISKNPATAGPYDIILALSVIKWIHLEHLDEGLERFFSKCSSSLLPGGYLVLEIQPWESYEKAIHPKKAPHFGERLQRLNYRPETSFTELLTRQGLVHCVTSEALPRRISVYRKDLTAGGCGADR